MEMKINDRKTVCCFKCGHVWITKNEHMPKRCPKCFSARWDVKGPRQIKCIHCGNEWIIGDMDDKCPICKKRLGEFESTVLHCNVCSHEWNQKKKKQPKRCPSCYSSKWDHPQKPKCVCKKCNYEWEKRSRVPKKCPSCQSIKWNENLAEVKCMRCGHIWRKQNDNKGETICPSCKSTNWEKPQNVCRCPSCGHMYIARQNKNMCVCPQCGDRYELNDYVNDENSNMVLWFSGYFNIRYVNHEGLGYLCLYCGRSEIAITSLQDVCNYLGLTSSSFSKEVNNGQMDEKYGSLMEYFLTLNKSDNRKFVLDSLQLKKVKV